MQPPARKIPKVLVSLFGVLALLVASAATAGAQDHDNDDTTTQSAKAITDYSCDESAWHFVITDMHDHAAPGSISVTFEDSTTEAISLEKVTGNVAHYTSAENADLRVSSATAQLPSDWSGQFNLSSGPCTFVEGDDEEPQQVECPDGTMVDDLADCPEQGTEPDEELECPDGQEAAMGDDGTEECVAVGGDDEENDDAEQGADKITICHATGSTTNPYVIITIAKQAVLNAHVDHQDGRDIIPAFDDFPGQPVGQGPITSIEDCPTTEDDDGNGDDVPVVGFADVEAVCVAGVHTTIAFDLTSDVDGTFNVVLLDGDDEIDAIDVEVFEGIGSDSFDFPEFDDELSLAVTVGDETVATMVTVGTCPPVTGPGNGGDDNGNGETPPVEVDDETEDPEIVVVPVPAPELPTDVADEEAVPEVVTPVTTFRPVVQPAGDVVVDQPSVMGDVTTRTVSGQLPRTGSDSAAGLAPFGLLLLLAGFALQRTGRRRSTIG